MEAGGTETPRLERTRSLLVSYRPLRLIHNKTKVDLATADLRS
jgi:hypothetical protein